MLDNNLLNVNNEEGYKAVRTINQIHLLDFASKNVGLEGWCLLLTLFTSMVLNTPLFNVFIFSQRLISNLILMQIYRN